MMQAILECKNLTKKIWAVKAGKGRDLLRGTSALCKRQRIDRLYGNGKFLL